MSEDLGESGEPSSEVAPDGEERLVRRIVETISPDRRVITVELVLSILLAFAAVLTAWAALQSAKWSGEQAIHFSEAGANRTESTRFDGRATSIMLLDSQTFLQWADAIGSESIVADANGEDPPDPTVYEPGGGSLSGYLFTQFREDFRPRVSEWLEGGGPENPDGNSPFFPLDDYIAESVPPAAESARLADVADEKAGLARDDNQNSDDYVITVVLLASVLFFAGVSSKLRSAQAQNLMVGVAMAMLLVACVRLLTLPIHALP
jgi:hypothetical protein